LAASGASFAQSTVTLSGTFGAGYQSFFNGTTAPTTVASRGLNPTTDASIKATIVEDLGGGMKVTAAGQFALGGSRGGNVTKEDSSVTLAGGFGAVSFASTRSSDTAIAANVFASWLPRVSFYDTVSSRAAGDLVTYTAPAISGVTFSVAQFEVTEGAGSSDQKVMTLGATYANGPLAVALAHKTTNKLLAAQVTAEAKKTNVEGAATYDLGVAKIGLGFDSATTGGTAYTSNAAVTYGVSIPAGAATLGVNGGKRGDRSFYDAGVNYDLSKRTSVRAQFGKITGTSSTTVNTQGNQYRVGILHNF
jgi:Gram-negative porin